MAHDSPTRPSDLPPPATALLTRDPPKREYTVQYGETDHDFIFRLLADSGLASFFDHADDTKWTLIDDTTLRSVPRVPLNIPFVSSSHLTPQNEFTPHVTGVAITSEIDTSIMTIRDFDYENPQFILQSTERFAGSETATGVSGSGGFKQEADLEAYEFAVGNFKLQTDGDARAKQLLEEARGTRRQLSCETSFALGAGTRMNLINHPRSDVGGALLVVRSTTSSRAQASGSNTVGAPAG